MFREKKVGHSLGCRDMLYKKLMLNDRIERIICTILSNNKFGIKTLLRFEIEYNKKK